MRFQTKAQPARAAATLIDYGDRLGFGPAPPIWPSQPPQPVRAALGRNAHPELMSSAFGHCSEAVVTLRLCQSQALAAGSWAEIVVTIQFARRSLLIRRVPTTPSADQSKAIVPPSWAAILRCTNLLPKPSSFVGATTGGPPRSVHVTTTSSS